MSLAEAGRAAEALRVADNIVSYQTPAGGWSKNQDRSLVRLPGQRFSNDAETMEQNPANFDAPADRFWTFVGTLDNNSTWTEMRYLAKVAAQAPGREGDAWRASVIKGVHCQISTIISAAIAVSVDPIIEVSPRIPTLCISQ